LLAQSVDQRRNLKQASHWHYKRFTLWHAIWRELVTVFVGMRGDAWRRGSGEVVRNV